MSQTDIYYKIKRILSFNFNVEDQGNIYTANLFNNLGLTRIEVNLLLYHVEQAFSINLKDGLEMEINSLSQLVTHVTQEMNNQRIN